MCAFLGPAFLEALVYNRATPSLNQCVWPAGEKSVVWPGGRVAAVLEAEDPAVLSWLGAAAVVVGDATDLPGVLPEHGAGSAHAVLPRAARMR